MSPTLSYYKGKKKYEDMILIFIVTLKGKVNNICHKFKYQEVAKTTDAIRRH